MTTTSAGVGARSAGLLAAGLLCVCLAASAAGRSAPAAGDATRAPGDTLPAARTERGTDDGSARADTLPELPAFELDGRLDEWKGAPSTFELPAPGAGRAGATVHLAQSPEGLAVAVRGLPSGDSLGLWLADLEDVELPPVGWGHQFGFEWLHAAAGCQELRVPAGPEACRRWFRRQGPYRERLRRLFRRRWVLSAGGASEEHATRAFAHLDSLARGKLAPLERWGVVRVQPGPAGAASATQALEALIPWKALPPSRPPDLTGVRVAVERWTSTETGSPSDGWSTQLLPEPRRYRTTPCRYGPGAVVLTPQPGVSHRVPSDSAAVYFLPAAASDLRRLLVVDSEAKGYQYGPDPETRSPAVFEATYWARRLDGPPPGGWLCGPVLAYRRGDVASRTAEERQSASDLRVSPGADLVVREEQVRVRPAPGGGLLVMEGPWSWHTFYGSGQCGGCPRTSVDVFHLDRRTGRVSHVFSYAGISPGYSQEGRDVRIQVADDWREVTVYELRMRDDAGGYPENLRWSSTKHCLRTGAPAGGDAGAPPVRYEVCEEREDVEPPPPREDAGG